MSLEILILVAWVASFALAIWLYPWKIEDNLAMLFLVAPLALVIILIIRIALISCPDLDEPVQNPNKEFICKYQLYLTLRKLKIKGQ